MLYSYALSPYAGKVHAFLNFKQLPFRVHYVNPLRAAKELDFTGQHFVPVVRIGEQWRADSTPIGLWLDEVFPELPLLPEGDAERTAILAIDQWAKQLEHYAEREIPTLPDVCVVNQVQHAPTASA